MSSRTKKKTSVDAVEPEVQTQLSVEAKGESEEGYDDAGGYGDDENDSENSQTAKLLSSHSWNPL